MEVGAQKQKKEEKRGVRAGLVSAGLDAGLVGEDGGWYVLGWSCAGAGPDERSKREGGLLSKKLYWEVRVCINGPK